MTAAAKSNTSYFELLVTAALACSHHRVLCDLYVHERFSPHLDKAGSDAQSALLALARHCRKTDTDARNSPLFQSFGPLAHFYEERYERKRVVIAEELTPRAIYDGVERGNTLRWSDWTISCSNLGLMDDAYGLPKWDCVVTAANESGESFSDGEDGSRRRARAIYKRITGKAFEGDDGLGRDEPHMYERGYDPDDDEDMP